MASSNTVFRFKQFAINQDRTPMKVGTDGVLLGCIAKSDTEADAHINILDIGTGTGLVAIMLAQRYGNAKVTAVEIDPDAAAQAAENCEASPFGGRIRVERGDIKEFKSAGGERFDLIVSNPPYFTESLQCPDGRRNMARHAVGLTYSDLMRAAANLLSDHGRIAIIIPYDSAAPLTEAAREAGLAPVRLTTIYSNKRKPPRRAVCQFAREEETTKEGLILEKNELTLLNLDGSNTTEYQEIAKDFYLDK